MFKNFNVQTRLMITITAIAFVSVFGVAWLVRGVLHLNEQSSDSYQQNVTLSNIHENYEDFLKAEQAVKNYLSVSNGQFYLELYQQEVDSIQQSIQEGVLGASTIEEKTDIDALQRTIDVYHTTFLSFISSAAPDDQQGLISNSQELDSLADQVRQQFIRIIHKRELYLQQMHTESDELTEWMVFGSVLILVAMVTMVILASITANQVMEPVLHLTNAVVAFENNTFQPHLLEAYTNDKNELGSLARSINNMVNTITNSVVIKDRFISATNRFVPTEYLDFLEKDSIIDVNLGDHVSAEMAVMFSDIRGFTTISEKMTPQENFDFVNDYLQRVSPKVREHNGFIVKYLGDGMMAIFPYGADDAVLAGIEKKKQIVKMNNERRHINLPPLSVGIGIHTGHMMVGMIGEANRMQGDAFSDNVNLTSRVEGLTVFYGVSMIITEEALMRLEEIDHYHTRFLGKVLVRGKEHPLSIYEIIDGDPEELMAHKIDTKADFEQGVKYYINGNLENANKSFNRVLVHNSNDQISKKYLERITNYLNQGLPPNWDGVEVMTSK